MNRVVGVSDAAASNDMHDVLVTYSLGSCIAVSMYDPVMRIGGLLHFQLPSAAADANRGKDRPLMFGDTGMQWLLSEMVNLGAEQRRLRVVLAGGAKMLGDENLFDIGRRNHAAIRKILWQKGLFITAEHVGGGAPRNLRLAVEDGTVTINCREEQIALT